MFRLTFGILLSASIFAAETKVVMKDLPPAVQRTVIRETKTANLRGLEKEVERGKTYYEAETAVNGKSRDILIDPNGTIVEIEESVALESLPEAARNGLQRAAGTGKILRVEAVTRGSAVSYEAVIECQGKKAGVSVNADGSRRKD